MNKREVMAIFEEDILPYCPPDDEIWIREEWCNFTDFLCKEGLITEHQDYTWTNPY